MTALRNLLAASPDGAHVFGSVGPVADAFVQCGDPVALLNGPVGSGKTTTLARKVVFEATRIVPWHKGVRRYVITVVRDKYTNLWGTTIPSWRKMFPEEIFGKIVGSAGRPADHTLDWDDEFGPVQVVAKFRAFGEAATEEDTRGWECTDALFDEMDLMEERFVTAMGQRIAREPVRSILGRPGRIYGACNAPDVLNWLYRDFWEEPKAGYRLFRQPGGLAMDAENKAIGRAYYEDIIAKNGHRPWTVKRMVHNLPGFTRDNDTVYPGYDDALHSPEAPLKADPKLPVLVGIDGGLTPAAVYLQEAADGGLDCLREIALDGAGMIALSREMLRLEAQAFRGCEFVTVCDPAMDAGEDTEEGSPRSQLARHLGRDVRLAETNDPERRHEPLRHYMERRLDSGRPAFRLDRSCRALRRGFAQTFCYRRIQGSNERSRVIKNPDSHPCDAAEYGALMTSFVTGKMARVTRAADAQRARDRAREAPRYDPLARRR